MRKGVPTPPAEAVTLPTQLSKSAHAPTCRHPSRCPVVRPRLPALPTVAQSLLAARTGTVPNGLLGKVVRAVGYHDGDGFHDFAMGLAGWNGNLGGGQVISGGTIAGRDAPSSVPGTPVLSHMPAGPTNLGVGSCDAWFDIRSGSALAALATAPDWSLQLPRPNARDLVGSEIALQAFYSGTNTPIGLDLTNGIWARLGY